MIYIDKYAYFSAFKNVRPELKLLFGLSALAACVCSGHVAAFAFVLAVMFYITVFRAKIPALYYMKLMLLPMGFLSLSLLGIIINFSAAPAGESIFRLYIGGVYVFATPAGAALAINLGLKSLGAVSCLYFIILTTPVRDIIFILSIIKCPPVMITLFTMIYQFIFLLMETALTKARSIRCRHGFGRGRYLNNFAMLWASVFLQSFIASEWIHKAMEVRGHGGSIKFLPKAVRLTALEVFTVGCFLAAVLLLNYL